MSKYRNYIYYAGRIISCALLLLAIFHFFPIQKAEAVLTSGELDTTFHNDDTSVNFVNGPDLEDVVQQDDGKILLAGGYFEYEYNGEQSDTSYFLLRLNEDGSIDDSFAAISSSMLDGYIRAIVLQSNGKVVVGGSFTLYGEISVPKIMRLNSDGSLDTSFEIGLGFNDDVSAITIDNEGNILVGGSFTTYDGTSVGNIVRLGTDGSLDTSFSATATSHLPEDLLVQEDGKILMPYWLEGGTPENGVLRLNSDGSLDTSFDLSDLYVAEIYTVALQSNGKILLGGDIDISDNSVDENVGVLRVNSDGSIDDTFSYQQIGVDEAVYSIAIQSSDKILIAGDFAEYDGIGVADFARLNSNGGIDTSFEASITGFDESESNVSSVYLGSDGMIFVSGYFWNHDSNPCGGFLSFDSNGNVQATFMWKPNGFNSQVFDIETQSDGKILVLQYYSSEMLEIPFAFVVRLNSDGTLDTSFSTNSLPFKYKMINTIEILSSGKILVGGWLGDSLSEPNCFLVRLNTDGSLDESFIASEGVSSTVLKTEELNNGKILVGYYSSGAPLVVLNEDGSLDTSFVLDPETDYLDDYFVVQEDGKIITIEVSGGGLYYTPARLNQDGSKDTTFNSLNASFNDVPGWKTSPLVQEDGRILFSGDFSSYGDEEVNNIVRLNTNGTLDGTFSISGTEGSYAYKLQEDGKIIGYRESDGNNFLVRYNQDGSIDESFTPYLWNGYLASLETQNNGSILVGGSTYPENPSLFRLNVHHQPSISQSQVGGVVNPTNISTLVPKFSVLISDEKTSDTVLKYQIQVNTNSLFTGTTMWDSGMKVFSTPIANNIRTSDILYAGNALTLDGTKYYWRMRVWDSQGDASEWSDTNNFTMASYTLNAPFGLAISPSVYSNTNSFRFTWSAGNARVKSYEYRAGGGWISTTLNRVSSLQAYKNGKNIVQVRSVDNAGNRSVASAISYYYDSIAPTVPTNLTVTDNSFAWTASTDEHSGIVGYEYRVGDTTSWISTESTLISNSLGLVNGENMLYVRAVDLAGNKSEPASIKYIYEDQDLEIDSSAGPQMLFTREGNESSVQNDTVAVKSGESITITIPVSEITVNGDSVSKVYVEIDGQETLLVLDKEKKIYTAKVSIPTGKAKGSILQTNQVVEYVSGEKSIKGVSIVIDPYGYVYTKSGGKENRLANAEVSLYSYINGNKELYVFSDTTKNPQNTDSDGEYSYFVPSGKYVLVVKLDGYKTYTSDVFEVNSGAVEQKIEMKKKLPISVYIIGGGVFVLLCVSVLALKKKEIDY